MKDPKVRLVEGVVITYVQLKGDWKMAKFELCKNEATDESLVVVLVKGFQKVVPIKKLFWNDSADE